MKRRTHASRPPASPPETPPAPLAQADYEALAREQKAVRADACTEAVLKAIQPLLEKYQCRVSTRQVWTDGKAGPVEILCVTVD